MAKDAVIHDYTNRFWGHDYTISEVIGRGQQLKAMGWGGGIKKGHFLKLVNGSGSSHYRVDDIEYFPDPTDMWKATLTFPRKVD